MTQEIAISQNWYKPKRDDEEIMRTVISAPLVMCGECQEPTHMQVHLRWTYMWRSIYLCHACLRALQL